MSLEENPMCLLNTKQHFLVSVSVHKARHLNIPNTDTFVEVSLDGKFKRTRTVYRAENPYFNEHFNFELQCSEKQLLQKSVRFTLFKASICTAMNFSIAECTVGLSTIWHQKDHAVFKKWASLDQVGGPALNIVNYDYLLVDISIASSFRTSCPIIFDQLQFDDIDNNQLVPYVSHNERVRVRYCCNILSGEFVKHDDYVVCISFAGSKASTKPSSYGKSCRWMEKLSFIGSFPSLNQIFLIELLTVSCCYKNVKSSKELQFSSISKPIDGFYQRPMFGPTEIHFYAGTQDTQYVGKLLISVETEVLPSLSVPAKKVQTDRLFDQIVWSNYWEEATFKVRFHVINFQCFKQFHSHQVRLYLSCADRHSTALTLPMEKFKTFNASHNAISSFSGYMELELGMHDNRHKYFVTFATNKMLEILNQLTEHLTLHQIRKEFNPPEHRHILLLLTSDVVAAADHAYEVIKSCNYAKHTKWDEMRKKHAIQELAQFRNNITAFQPQMSSNIDSEMIERMLMETNSMQSMLIGIATDEQNCYPDLLMHFIRPGQASSEAICRFTMNDYFLPPSPSSPAGSFVGKRCTILPRSIHCNHSCRDRCGCIYGKLDFMMAIDTESNEKSSPPNNVTDSQVANHVKTVQVDCVIHVHQGRIYCSFEETASCNARLTVLFENNEISLPIESNTLSPCWNETIEFKNVPFAASSSILNGPEQQQSKVMFILQHVGNKTISLGIGWEDAVLIDYVERPTVESGENLKSMHALNQLAETSRCHFGASLRWVQFYRLGARVAEILISVAIRKVYTARRDASDDNNLVVHGIPEELLPTFYPFQLNVTFVGLRQICAKASQLRLKKSRIMITIGETSVLSGFVADTYGSSVNFVQDKFTSILRLPECSYYWPLIVMKHLDFSEKNRIKTIGVAVLNTSEITIEYRRKKTVVQSSLNSTIVELQDDDRLPPLLPSVLSNRIRENVLQNINFPFQLQPAIIQESLQNTRHHVDTETTWWTRFYNTLQQKEETITMEIFTTELENVAKFNRFRDWSGSYPLYKVKTSGEINKKQSSYGVLKCKVMFTLLEEPKIKPSPIESGDEAAKVAGAMGVTVVVYVVQALNLTSRDITSESDAYIVLTYGSERVRDRAYYVPNQASPVFGRRFEMRGFLPRDQMLNLSLYDRDFVSPDDLIGSTCIDIEDRFHSRHLPTFGLPKRYSSAGSNQWRHPTKPSEMLRRLCTQHALAHPTISGRNITVNGVEFETEAMDPNECGTEQLCLLALNRFEAVPGGFPLTPEHVETRSLYHPKRVGIEQGKVQLWVEIYETGQPQPQPLDITPQPPKSYELRVIVWNTAEVVLNERNIFGREMSDIYVKCWLQEFAKAQHTDVHYRSLTGEGNFNWRMVFPFRYSPADGMLAIRQKKAFYEQYDTELKLPPVLTVQIWDNDSFSPDDFLGTVDLTLSHLPTPARSPESCGLDRGTSRARRPGNGHGFVNLFRQGRVRGWFPVHGNSRMSLDRGKTDGPDRRALPPALTGKIELELEILGEEDAVQAPVGLGRKSPQHLPDPLRPEVSFNWMRQPARAFHKILWPGVRKSFAWLAAAVLLAMLLYGLIINLPTVFMVRTLEGRKSSTDQRSELISRPSAEG